MDVQEVPIEILKESEDFFVIDEENDDLGY